MRGVLTCLTLRTVEHVFDIAKFPAIDCVDRQSGIRVDVDSFDKGKVLDELEVGGDKETTR